MTYFPHLITYIIRLQFHYIPLRSKIAYLTYWFSYCLLVLGVLIWCLIVVCRKQTMWQIIQVSGYVLIAKLIYTLFDVTVRILLHYSNIVIAFDIVHIILLLPAILFTYLLIRHVKQENMYESNSQKLNHLEHEKITL